MPARRDTANKKVRRGPVKSQGVATRSARRGPRQRLPLQVLIKFRAIINSTKRHFKWVEQQCGISGVQLWALWELGRAPNLRVTELAAAMAMHQSTASSLLNGLVEAGLIRREYSRDDRRAVRLSVTNAGAKLLSRAPKPVRGVLPEALHLLSGSELRVLDALLKRILRKMRPIGKGAMNVPLAYTLTGK